MQIFIAIWFKALAMNGLWAKGASRDLLHGTLSAYWENKLFKRRRNPGSVGIWLPGDYILFDVSRTGHVGGNLDLLDRELALVKTFRYMWPDKRQPAGGQLKRWYDYVVLRRVRRRRRGPGWRVVWGTWNAFGRSGGRQRFEWRIEFGGRLWYVHRLVVHAKTGYGLTADWWQTEHLAGTVLWEADAEAGWCLGTWDALAVQVWDETAEDWEPVPQELKRIALEQLRRYRRGNYWY